MCEGRGKKKRVKGYVKREKKYTKEEEMTCKGRGKDM